MAHNEEAGHVPASAPSLEVIDGEPVECFADGSDYDNGGRLAPEDEERMP